MRRARWSLPTRITLTSRHLTASFRGQVQFDGGLRLEGRLEVRTPSLALLSAWLGHGLPEGLDPGPLEASGDAIWRDGQLTIEQVQFILDGQQGQGTLGLSVTGRTPFLDGSLAFGTLDAAAVRRWLGRTPAVMAGDGSAGVGSTGARIGLIDAIDSDLRISVAHVAGLGMPANRLALSVSARSGELIADLAEVEVADGTASGQFKVDQGSDSVRYAARGVVNRVSLETLLAGLAPVRGNGTLRFDVAGRGRTLGEVMRTLNGELQVSMPLGGRLPVDVWALLADARERKRFKFASHERQAAEFESFQARLAVRQGTLLSEHVALRSAGSLVTGDGMIQPSSGRIYLRLLTDYGQGLARTARLGRSQSVLMHGDLTNPTVLIEEATGVPVTAAAAGGRP